MIASPFIYDMLDLLLDGDEQGFVARNQLPFLTEAEIEIIADGFVVYFTNETPEDAIAITDRELGLDGLLIQNDTIGIYAEAAIYLEDGKVDCLEVWAVSGEIPMPDLKSYTLTQVWEDSPGRTLTTD